MPFGYWTSKIFHEDVVYQSDRNKGNGKRRAYVERRRVSDSEDSDYDDSDDDGEIIRPRQVLRGPISASYPTSQLTPLTTSPAWHEINAQLNIHLTGPDSLQGLCDEAHFARSCLTKTSSALLKKSTQAEAARFCIEQIKDEDRYPQLANSALYHLQQTSLGDNKSDHRLRRPSTLSKRIPEIWDCCSFMHQSEIFN